MPVKTAVDVPCPNAEELRKLLRGKLPAKRHDDLTGHLDECSVCQAKLELLADGDTNLSQSVKHIDQAEPPKSSAYWKVIDAESGNVTGVYAAVDAKALKEKKLDFLKPTDLPGKLGRIGDFEVIREIGRGGMGIVLQAYDPSLEREVAIKVLDPSLSKNETARQRFCREARAAAAVSHENLVAVYSVHEEADAGLPYFVMQLVAGETLEERIRREGKLSVDAVTKIAWQAAQGLSAAHAGGLIHRDIKPGNILLETGTDKAKLTDFGLARAAEDLKLTRTGFVAGTPLYMAPEQAKGDDVDARADLFSLGAVMYEALAGKPPFDGKTPLAVLRRVADEAHPRLSRINPEVPDWLEDTIDELLEKDPAKRTQSATALASTLVQHFSGDACASIASPAECTVARTASRIVGTRRKSALITATVLGLPLLLGLLIGAFVAWRLKPKTIEQVPTAPLSGAKAVDPLVGPDPLYAFNAESGAVLSVTVAGDGQTIAAGLEDGSFAVWNIGQNKKTLTKQAHEGPIWAIDFSEDGRTLITASDDGTVKVWRISGGAELIQTFEHPTSVRSAALDPSAMKVVTGDRAGMVRIWEIDASKPLEKNPMYFYKHPGTVNAVSFAPSLETLDVVSASSNKSVILWEIPHRAVRETFTKHTGPVYGVAFSPDGEWIASASWDKSVIIWRADNTEVVSRINAHDDGVLSLAFSCCGKILATTGQDGTVKVWDAKEGREIRRFTRHQGTVHSVKFMPKGEAVITGGRDGTVRIWPVK